MTLMPLRCTKDKVDLGLFTKNHYLKFSSRYCASSEQYLIEKVPITNAVLEIDPIFTIVF